MIKYLYQDFRYMNGVIIIMYRVLILDDDQDYVELLKKYLENNGFTVAWVRQPSEVIKMIEDGNKYEAIIIDLFLDKFNGRQVAQMIRDVDANIPLIILTSSSEASEEIKSLQANIDEYVKKEWELSVILERIKKVINKNVSESQSNLLTSNGQHIEVDVVNRAVKQNGEMIKLTPIQFDLLVYFLRNKNKLLTREDIFCRVWGLDLDDLKIDSRNIDVQVKNIRTKLNLNNIYSVRALGYRWYEKV